VNAPEVLVPFAAPYLGDDERRAVEQVLDSGWVGTGSQAREAEKEFSRYLGLPHTLLLNSGTAALHLALLVNGIGAGDEVIVPTVTFTATAATVVHAGGVPIFVDVESDTLNIDVQRAREAITSRTRALIVVHMAGRMADVVALRRLCDEHALVMIEDSAHALPAVRNGLGPGQIADAVGFSFFVTKPLTSVEGGLLATRQETLLANARVLSAHGIARDAVERHRFGGSPHYDVVAAGFKYNLPDLLAALLRCQLQRADWMHERRRAIAEAYLAALGTLPGFELPLADGPDDRSSWYLFIVRLPVGTDRDGFARRLAERGVGTSVHLRPLHQFSYYAEQYPTEPGRVAVADAVYPRLLSLPIYPGMSERDVDVVIEAVTKVASQPS
jgi:dTDP-4-amino-4,6-dideoxygalactose transaminase